MRQSYPTRRVAPPVLYARESNREYLRHGSPLRAASAQSRTSDGASARRVLCAAGVVKKVTSRKQAIAIGLSEARKAAARFHLRPEKSPEEKVVLPDLVRTVGCQAAGPLLGALLWHLELQRLHREGQRSTALSRKFPKVCLPTAIRSCAVLIDHWSPLFSLASSDQARGTEMPRPGRARADQTALTVVAPNPLRK